MEPFGDRGQCPPPETDLVSLAVPAFPPRKWRDPENLFPLEGAGGECPSRRGSLQRSLQTRHRGVIAGFDEFPGKIYVATEGVLAPSSFQEHDARPDGRSPA